MPFSHGGGSLCILGVKIDGRFFVCFFFFFSFSFLSFFLFFPFFSVYAFFPPWTGFFFFFVIFICSFVGFSECLTLISLHFQLYIKIQAMKRFVLKKVFVPKKNL